MLFLLGFVAVVVGLILVIGIVVAVARLVAALVLVSLWLAADAVVATVAGIAAAGMASSGQEWLGAPAALAAGAATLWLTRDWARQAIGGGQVAAPPNAPASDSIASLPVAPPRLVAASLQQRLAATEAALVHAARDGHGAPAAEWLEFWRRRVPELIASAQDVFDDADPAERPPVVAQLADHLDRVIIEAERRIAVVRQTRRDLFATRGRHADGRVREG